MPRGRPKRLVTLTAEDAKTLERWARRPTTAQALALRARIVLACSSGQPDTAIAREARSRGVLVKPFRLDLELEADALHGRTSAF